MSVTGITGERELVPEDLVQRIEWLRSQTDTPICVGFGVSTAAHVRSIAPLADGVIVGSALVRRIAEASDARMTKSCQTCVEFAATMIAALD